MSAEQPTSRSALPLILVVALFFMWGVANHLNDILIPQFKKAFTLTDFQSGLIQSAFYLGYFIFAIPAALFMKRFGYKAAVVLGLLLYASGAFLFFPAADQMQYAFFLGALFVIASGLAFLETSANPLVTVLGAPETSERRLNFAQAFNPLGALTAVFVGQTFILSGGAAGETAITEAHAVQTPYLVLGCVVLVWAAVVALTPFPPVAGAKAARDEGPGRVSDYLALFGHRTFIFGVLAQFCYVGAQTGVFSFMIRYSQHALAGTNESTGSSYLFTSLIGFMIGRFVGTGLMWRIAPWLIMTVFAVVNVALMAVAFLAPGQIGLYAMVATPFFMSIMFPTIFALSVKNLGPLTKAGSSLLIMSIIGGAIFPAMMGRVSDMSAINVAMLSPLACFAVIAFFGLAHAKAGKR